MHTIKNKYDHTASIADEFRENVNEQLDWLQMQERAMINLFVYYLYIQQSRQLSQRNINKQKFPLKAGSLSSINYQLSSPIYPFKTSLEITIFCISEVPSPMVHSLESR